MGTCSSLLEGLRRVADRMTVYGQRGRMIVPRGQHVLYGLLEPLIVEVASPGGGAFHPKLWILRFVAPDDDEVLLRLLVLSRNLTGDRSWDLSLRLRGRTARPVSSREPGACGSRARPAQLRPRGDGRRKTSTGGASRRRGTPYRLGRARAFRLGAFPRHAREEMVSGALAAPRRDLAVSHRRSALGAGGDYKGAGRARFPPGDACGAGG